MRHSAILCMAVERGYVYTATTTASSRLTSSKKMTPQVRPSTISAEGMLRATGTLYSQTARLPESYTVAV